LVGVFLLPGDDDDDEGINDAKMSSRLPALAFFVFVFVATSLAAGEASSLPAGVVVAAALVVVVGVAGFLVFFPGRSAAMMSSRLSLDLALLVAPAFATGGAADIDTALFSTLLLGVVVAGFIDTALSAGAGVAGVEDDIEAVVDDDEAGVGEAAVAVVAVVVSLVFRFFARAPTSRYLKADSSMTCTDGGAFAFVFAFGVGVGVGVGVDAMGTSRGRSAATGDGGTLTLAAALRLRDDDDGVDEAGVLVVAEVPTAAADEVVVVEDEDAGAGKARDWEASV
jgi:hypothetical protein